MEAFPTVNPCEERKKYNCSHHLWGVGLFLLFALTFVVTSVAVCLRAVEAKAEASPISLHPIEIKPNSGFSGNISFLRTAIPKITLTETDTAFN
eukprot:scaffold948_cov106-Cylindrotheca_fusiformis.AAC.4